MSDKHSNPSSGHEKDAGFQPKKLMANGYRPQGQITTGGYKPQGSAKPPPKVPNLVSAVNNPEGTPKSKG